MTREIKFRALDKKSKQFVDDFVIDRAGNEYQTNKCEFWGDDREIVLMQFTGLKDKNGKDIYEGDIIDFKHHKGYLLDDCVGVMEWIVCEYVIKTSSFVKPVTIHLSIIDELQEDLLNHIEVIGNIYEHSYLLDNK